MNHQKNNQIALIGNPNSGKTSIFNAITGLRHKTANYPGVTVEKKVGIFRSKLSDKHWEILDLPGTYSLLPRSLDEEITHNVLLGLQKDIAAPDLIIVVADASNIERNLYLATQVLELKIPTIVALNMWDVALDKGIQIDLAALEKMSGCKCVRTIASRRNGTKDLEAAILEVMENPDLYRSKMDLNEKLPPAAKDSVQRIYERLVTFFPGGIKKYEGEALRLLCDSSDRSSYYKSSKGTELKTIMRRERECLTREGIDWSSLEAEKRYELVETLIAHCVKIQKSAKVFISDKLDSILTHPVWGLASFAVIMSLLFQSIFSWAEGPMNGISLGVEWLGQNAGKLLPDGQLKSLVVDGMIAGVGNVIIFLPQIFFLFFFIAVFEDSGYMARAAFVLDRLMKKAGLNGKAFLPLLSSFACAVPGIMATRSIEDRNDRLVTILVAPLMSCSARLPVYTLMIAGFIPSVTVFHIFNSKGLTLFCLYFLSIAAGLLMASLFRKRLFKGQRTPFIFELPPYRLPNLSTVFLSTWDRGKEFLVRAGSIIFFLSIILWFLVSYPDNSAVRQKYQFERDSVAKVLSGHDLEMKLAAIQHAEDGDMIRQSFAGRMGQWIEPVIRPLGFDWKIGIGLVASFAAREVLVSTLAIVYNIGAGADENSVDLIKALQNERSRETGKLLYTPLTAVSLMVFFVLACQCMSTVAIVRRETQSWKWPAFMVSYMTVLAWTGSFLVYQIGTALRWGV